MCQEGDTLQTPEDGISYAQDPSGHSCQVRIEKCVGEDFLVPLLQTDILFCVPGMVICPKRVQAVDLRHGSMLIPGKQRQQAYS